MFAMPSVKHCVKPAAAVISQDGANFELNRRCYVLRPLFPLLHQQPIESIGFDVTRNFKPFDG